MRPHAGSSAARACVPCRAGTAVTHTHQQTHASSPDPPLACLPPCLLPTTPLPPHSCAHPCHAPHRGEEWSYLRGGLTTLDHDYGLFNKIHHDIGTHVVHHLVRAGGASDGLRARAADHSLTALLGGAALAAVALVVAVGSPAATPRSAGRRHTCRRCFPRCCCLPLVPANPALQPACSHRGHQACAGPVLQVC